MQYLPTNFQPSYSDSIADTRLLYYMSFLLCIEFMIVVIITVVWIIIIREIKEYR